MKLNPKLVLLGDSSVGKTALIRRYATDTFSNTEASTVVAATTNVQFTRERDSLTLSVTVWDTAGQENFRSLAPVYYQDAQLALIVFSVEDSETFNSISSWIQQVKDSQSDIIILLCGNKNDLENRDINFDTAFARAQELQVPYTETSAKNGEGVKEAFEKLFEEYLDKYGSTCSEPCSTSTAVPINPSFSPKSGCCSKKS